MTAYLLRDAAGTTRSCRLSNSSGHSGATGEIFPLRDDLNSCAKIYHDPAFARRMAPKIETMLRRPPDQLRLSHDGREFHQFAWPTAIIQRVDGTPAGFVMPLISFSETVSLESVLSRAARQRSKIREAWSFRLSVARNLAGLVASIHKRQHLLVDIKPLNFRVYRDWPFVCALDTDGFAVAGDASAQYPAEHISEPYIAPESRHRMPEQADIHQDQFALAVLLFQVINNGIHPYQGQPTNVRVPASAQEKIYGGFYAYGDASKDIRPSPTSVHGVFDADTRAMFTRAFTSSPPFRPSAADWYAHLSDLSRAPRLRACDVVPGHVRFAKGCPSCEYERLLGVGAPAANVSPINGTPLGVAVLPLQTVGVSSVGRSFWGFLRRFRIPMAIAAVLALAYALDSAPSRRPISSTPPGTHVPTTPTTAPSTPAPRPAPRPAPSPDDLPTLTAWPALVSFDWSNRIASAATSWSMSESTNNCSAVRAFANGLTLRVTIFKNVSDQGALEILVNPWWGGPAPPDAGSSRTVSWYFEGLKDTAVRSTAAIYEDRQILVSLLSKANISGIANATGLFVKIDGVTAAFSLAGSARMLAQLYACTGQTG